MRAAEASTFEPMAKVQDLINRHFPPETHPYRVFERVIDPYIKPEQVVLEVGCGRTAPLLSHYKSRGAKLIGIDLVEFDAEPGLQLLNANVSDMSAISSASVDLVYSRSVMEHVNEIEAAYAEIVRVLQPGGSFVFLTPNFWDYGSLIARLLPNRLHGPIVKSTEGRDEEDTFPVVYKSNTAADIQRLSEQAGLRVKRLEFLGQYPNYLVFNRTLFRLGCAYAKLLDRYHMLRHLRGWILCHLEKPANS